MDSENCRLLKGNVLTLCKVEKSTLDYGFEPFGLLYKELGSHLVQFPNPVSALFNSGLVPYPSGQGQHEAHSLRFRVCVLVIDK